MMTKVVLLFFVLISTASAGDPVCIAPPVSLEKQLMGSVSDVVAPIADQASCDATNLLDAQNEFKKRYPDTRTQLVMDVDGINLQGSADEIAFANKVLKGNEGDRQPKSWPSVATGCTSVVCGLTKLFGSEESALRVLNIAQRSGYVVACTQEGNPDGVEQIWKTSEIRSIDRVTASAPEQFQHLGSMKYFKRRADGVRKPDTALAIAWADYNRQEIVLLDQTFTESQETDLTIFHELSHQYDYQGLDTPSGDYLSTETGFAKLSGWDSGTLTKVAVGVETVYKHAPDASFVTDYAGTAPLEDFAETSAAYRFRPNDLKVASPEKYQLMKDKVFKGVEYSESAGWPALDKALNTVGGQSGLLSACISNLAKVDLPGNENDPTIWMTDPTNSVQMFGGPASILAPTCLKAVEEKILAQVQSDPEYCSRGGASFVRTAMERTIDGALVDLTSRAKKASLSTTGDSDCPDKKDLTHNCPVTKSLQRDPNFSKLTSADQKIISDQFEKMMPPNSQTAAVLAVDFPTARLFLSCLTAVDALKVVDDEVRYTTKTTTGTTWTEGYMEDLNCQKALAKAYSDSGYTTNSDVISQTLLKDDVEKLFDNFEKDVLGIWAKTIASCPSTQTSAVCTSNLVAHWAAGQGLDAKDVSDVLIPYLKSHVTTSPPVR